DRVAVWEAIEGEAGLCVPGGQAKIALVKGAHLVKMLGCDAKPADAPGVNGQGLPLTRIHVGSGTQFAPSSPGVIFTGQDTEYARQVELSNLRSTDDGN